MGADDAQEQHQASAALPRFTEAFVGGVFDVLDVFKRGELPAGDANKAAGCFVPFVSAAQAAALFSGPTSREDFVSAVTNAIPSARSDAETELLRTLCLPGKTPSAGADDAARGDADLTALGAAVTGCTEAQAALQTRAILAPLGAARLGANDWTSVVRAFHDDVPSRSKRRLREEKANKPKSDAAAADEPKKEDEPAAQDAPAGEATAAE